MSAADAMMTEKFTDLDGSATSFVKFTSKKVEQCTKCRESSLFLKLHWLPLLDASTSFFRSLRYDNTVSHHRYDKPSNLPAMYYLTEWPQEVPAFSLVGPFVVLWMSANLDKLVLEP